MNANEEVISALRLYSKPVDLSSTGDFEVPAGMSVWAKSQAGELSYVVEVTSTNREAFSMGDCYVSWTSIVKEAVRMTKSPERLFDELDRSVSESFGQKRLRPDHR